MLDVDNVVDFCFDELNIGKGVVVNIYLENLLKEDGVKGWCQNGVEYEIELDENLDNDEMLVTLCHEMVHVKQYSEGRDADEDEAYDLEMKLAEKYKKVV